MKRFLLFTGFLFSFFIGFGQCPSGNVILTSQAEVDAFAVNFPDCNIIAETLIISGSDIVNLAPLSNLTTVNILEIVDNQLLTNLNGLNALFRVGSSISISNNPNLSSLQGIQGLFGFENSGGMLTITNNVNLMDISALDFFSLFMPYEAIIMGNTSLTSCALNSFCEIIISNGDITIENNGPNCNSIEEVSLSCNPCSSLALVLSSQAEIDSFQTVYQNCLDGFINVVISGADITDLSPLSTITFVAGDLRIVNNEQLTTLDGLNNLSSTIVLDIDSNPQLSDITAISNALNNDSSIELLIRNNPLLEVCSFVAMCNFLSENIIEATIENNGAECADVNQVSENCSTNLNTISGTIVYDFNNDGCDVNDYAAGNVLIQIENDIFSQTSITDDQGNFSLFVDNGSSEISIVDGSIPSIFQSVPSVVEITFEEGGNEEIIDFCIEGIEVINDIAVTLIPLQEPRPGFDADYVISYTNLGTTIESGTITMNFDEEILFYQNSTLIPSSINETSIQWEFNDILPFETRTFSVAYGVFIPPTVMGGEILSSQVVLSTTNTDDVIVNNVSNIRELVVNSYDPNDKQVLQGEQILEEEVGNYLDYVVRFQNTGTADAINVVVTDTLSDNLNWNTLRILSSSDDFRLEITNENEVAFIFENINLPPEEEDEEGSNGHIAFQIRSNDDLVLGDAIENTANIFFDFNAPIITNTVVTTVSEPCPDGDLIFNSQVEIDAFPINFPNCTMISFPNNVIISGADIVDLTPLSQIISIDDNLTINNNPQLVSLEGLENISFIGNDLTISNNPILSSLNGLGTIAPLLSVQIINNDSLINLDGLNGLEEVTDLFIIENNDMLQSFSGLDNYNYSGASFIRNNISLSSLEGLEGVNFVDSLIIENNPSLIDISSLENVVQIVGSIEIINNDVLTNLNGLQNIGATFNFAIGIRLSDNEALEDISALSDYETPTQFIEITGNSSLSDCVNPFLCINTSNSILTINNNAPDCNSVEEVEEQCLLGVEEELLESEIKLYPNPTTGILNITLPLEVALQRIEVFSVTGKKVFTTQDVTIDFSSLAKGMYFARIMTNKGVITKKIVKK